MNIQLYQMANKDLLKKKYRKSHYGDKPYLENGNSYSGKTTSLYQISPQNLMMTSSNGNIFRVTGHLCGEFNGSGEFPAQRPLTRSFDIFFDLCPNNGWVNNREAGDLRRYVMRISA